LDGYAAQLSKFAVSRRFSYCEGITTVTITIAPDDRLENFVFFENISKECVPDLELFLTEIFGGGKNIKIAVRDDPLIVWAFEELDGETEVGYRLNISLSEECRKQLDGLGIGVDDTCDDPLTENDECDLADEECGDDNVEELCGISQYAVPDEFMCDNLRYEKRFFEKGCADGSCLTRDKWLLEEDCENTLTEETDSGADFLIAGEVRDYDSCENSLGCRYTTYKDTCSGNMLTEYIANGASYSQQEKNCEDFETGNYCDGSTVMKKEWGCNSGYCSDAAVSDSLVDDCQRPCSDGSKVCTYPGSYVPRTCYTASCSGAQCNPIPQTTQTQTQGCDTGCGDNCGPPPCTPGTCTGTYSYCDSTGREITCSGGCSGGFCRT